MFKAAIPAVLAASLLFPVAAQAQNLAPSADAKNDSTFVIRPGQWAAVGVGAVTGLVVGEALFSTELGMAVGGLVGAYLANVLYNGYQIEIRMGMAGR